jgi:CubicO group peptidase (beta-lactamase class C family)
MWMRRMAIGLVFAALCSSAMAAAAPPTPDQAQTLGRIYAEAVNSDAGVEAFLKVDAEPVPPAAIRGFFADQRWIMGGGVDFVGARVRPGAPGVVEVAVRGRLYGAVQGVELLVSEGAEPRITGFDLTPAPRWAVSPGEPVSEAALAARIAGLVDKGCAADRFSGAVLVAHGAKVVVQRACGEASRRYHVANTTGTRFNLGSIDKMFTAVSAMQLAEAGRFSLDDTLDKHLDASWLDPAVARQVTVWQLMTHTSGLTPDVVELAEDLRPTKLRELADYKPLARQARISFPPGGMFEYSNTGMLLLGAVVAQASGEDYYAYVDKHVLRPAMMTSTGSFAIDDPVESLAIGHIRWLAAPSGWRENTVHNLLRGIPAGGGYSTVGDLHRFALALQDGGLVSKAGLERMWTDEGQDNYGAGFELVQGAVGRTAGHSGFIYGVSTKLRIYRDSGYILVVLANIDRAAPPLVDAIEEALLAAPKR